MADDEARTATLAALLAWHRDIGAGDAIGDRPLDWLGRGDAAPPGDAFRLADTAAPAANREPVSPQQVAAPRLVASRPPPPLPRPPGRP